MRLRSVIFKFVFYVWGTIACLIGAPALYLPGAPRRWLVRLQTLWSQSVIFWLRTVLNLRMEIRGAEHIAKGPVIYAMKHQSMLDTFIMHAIIHDPSFIMKKELLKIPLYGRLCAKVGNIPIDREMGRKSMKQMLLRSHQEKDAGRPVVIFPEGSRAAPGEKHPYMTGIFGIYKYLKVPVVPVAVNTGLFWPRDGKLKKGTFVIEFLPPIEPGIQKQDFMSTLEGSIETASRKLLVAV